MTLHAPPWAGYLLLIVLMAGCATQPKVDWDKRVGNYTYDQAVMDYGPPDKSARLSDGRTVAQWLTSRGSVIVNSPPYYPYGPFYTAPIGPVVTTTTPNYYLRLIFDADGKLTASKKFME